MQKQIVFVVGAVLLSGCAGGGGWQGTASESGYDTELERQRQTAVINNDDYYEYHKDNKIYVLSDAREYGDFLQTWDVPRRVTEIGGGPKGETLVFAIAGPEAKKSSGFGSVEMYKGRRQGATKDFYAEVFEHDHYYVFGDWASLEGFRKSHSASGKATETAGDKVTYVGDSEALSARFKKIRGK